MGIHSLAVVALVLAAAPCCISAEPGITIAFYNLDGAPESLVARGIQMARSALQAAGISSYWVICRPEGCERRLSYAEPYIEFFLVPQRRATLPRGAGEPSAGLALKGEFAHPRGYAFLDAVRALSDRMARPVELVLSSVIVHEVGHLLGLEHQPSGVMRANLRPADIDTMLMGRAFCSGEKQKLRAVAERDFGSLPEPGMPPNSITPPSLAFGLR